MHVYNPYDPETVDNLAVEEVLRSFRSCELVESGAVRLRQGNVSGLRRLRVAPEQRTVLAS